MRVSDAFACAATPGRACAGSVLCIVSEAAGTDTFYPHTWADYSTHKPGTFRLSPPDDHLPMWMADYKAMQGPMFFGPTPSFEEMMIAVSQFEKTFNATANG